MGEKKGEQRAFKPMRRMAFYEVLTSKTISEERDLEIRVVENQMIFSRKQKNKSLGIPLPFIEFPNQARGGISIVCFVMAEFGSYPTQGILLKP